MNKFIGIGRLTRDVETRRNNDLTISRYTLAIDRKVKQEGQPTADFINCVAFGKAAEFAEKYLRQGTKIAIVGRIQTGSYTNRDGQKVYTTDIVIEEQEFAESKGNGEQRNTQEPPKPTPHEIGDGFMNIPPDLDDELPFN